MIVAQKPVVAVSVAALVWVAACNLEHRASPEQLEMACYLEIKNEEERFFAAHGRYASPEELESPLQSLSKNPIPRGNLSGFTIRIVAEGDKYRRWLDPTTANSSEKWRIQARGVRRGSYRTRSIRLRSSLTPSYRSSGRSQLICGGNHRLGSRVDPR
ncbi:MAG: hypothetical protein U0Q16_06585 [Bryobacteraceae bacterium]